MAPARVPGTLRTVHSRGPRHALGPGVAGFFAATLIVLVVLALAAPERHSAPRGGEFAVAGRQSSHMAPGAVTGPSGAAFDLRFAVDPRDHRLTRVRVHSHLPCADGHAIDDDVAVALPGGAAEAGHGTFDVRAGGVRMHGFFLSPDRATGTLTRSVGRCAIASAQWTARRTTSG
jgi:hypothetical protein